MTMNLHWLLAILLVLPVSVSAGDNDEGIGYATVGEALSQLKQHPDASVSIQSGWIIIEMKHPGKTVSENAVWSFTPPQHYAHPSVIKRRILEEEGDLFVDMQALCHAEKHACESLMDAFSQLNDNLGRSLSESGSL